MSSDRNFTHGQWVTELFPEHSTELQQGLLSNLYMHATDEYQFK